MQPGELRKIAEGREAEMFAWEENTVLRLLRNPQAQAQLQAEAATMRAAADRGVRVPAVHALTTVMGRPGMVMERLDGPDLLTLIGRRPWKVFWVARVTGEMHARLHEAVASSRMWPLKEVLRQRIQSYEGLPAHLADFALGRLDELSDGDRICHGDFHPGNVLMAGAEPVLIDWTGATRGEPAADVARARVILTVGEPPPGTSAPLRLMALFGRRLLVALYLRAYRRRRPLEMDLVDRWEVPVAAARLADGIAEEVPALLALLERRYAAEG